MNNIIRRTWKHGGMVNIEDLRGSAFQAESGGHTFVITGVDENGDALALSGTPSGVLLRADGQDVTLTCSVSDGAVYATLPANAYVVPGRVGITIFLTADGQKTAIYAAIAAVATTSTGTVAPPAGSDVVDLVNAIEAAIAEIPASDTNLKGALAPTYSTSAVYSVGSYAWYDGKLYKCTTAITSGETWTSAHWTEAKLAGDVYDLKCALNNIGDISLIEFTNGAYVTTNKSTDGTKTVNSDDIHSNADWSYAFVNCQPGDLFTIHATRGTSSSPRLWAFVNSNDILISKETSNATLDFETIKAPANAAKVIFNGKTADGIAVYKGVPIIDRAIKWKDSPANNADLNDLGTETAFYNLALANSFQNTPTGYEAANSFRRLLICMKSEDASLCYQVFVCSTDGTVWSRAYIGGDTGWSAWRNDTKALDDRSVAYRNIMTGYDPNEGTGDDLDSFMTPGIWEIKNTGGNWKPKNYPLNTGGMLTVIGANTSTVSRTIQIVANASQFMYRFGKGASAWTEWNTVFNANAPLFEPDSSNKVIDQLLSRVRALEEEHNIDPIPSYYTDHVNSKISTINGLAPTTGGQFAFITDIHINGYALNGGAGNRKHSHSILNKITAETGVKKVFNGGDNINGRSTQSYADVINRQAIASAYAKPDNDTPEFFIGGNHDLGKDSGVSATISQDALMASSNLFAPYIYGVVYDEASPFQYYYDDKKEGIRYIVLCMGLGDGSSSSGSSTEWWPGYESWNDCASFFADALNSTPSGYHVVVFNHISGIKDGGQSDRTGFSVVGTYTVGQKYMNYMYKMFVAYKAKTTYTDPSGNEYDFSGAVGVPVCMIFGHTHRDITGSTDDITDDGTSIGGSIPLFVTTTDNCGGNLDIDVTRTKDTVSEQAFDVFTVDTTNRKIYVTRIGGGNDRTNGGNGYSY